MSQSGLIYVTTCIPNAFVLNFFAPNRKLGSMFFGLQTNWNSSNVSGSHSLFLLVGESLALSELELFRWLWLLHICGVAIRLNQGDTLIV